MKPSVLVEKNVKAFIQDLNQYSAQVSPFYSECLRKFNKHQITSPLEQLFYASMESLIHLNAQACIGPLSMRIHGNRYTFIDGVKILPQELIDRYRVDFKMTYYHKSLKSPLGWLHGFSNELIVEIDSKTFHDRTEQDRTNEKKRGRFLVSKGYKILRFTGSEIFKDPLGKAAEVLEILIKRRIKRIEMNRTQYLF